MLGMRTRPIWGLVELIGSVESTRIDYLMSGWVSGWESEGVIMCLLVCACLPACLSACLPACLPACVCPIPPPQRTIDSEEINVEHKVGVGGDRALTRRAVAVFRLDHKLSLLSQRHLHNALIPAHHTSVSSSVSVSLSLSAYSSLRIFPLSPSSSPMYISACRSSLPQIQLSQNISVFTHTGFSFLRQKAAARPDFQPWKKQIQKQNERRKKDSQMPITSHGSPCPGQW